MVLTILTDSMELYGSRITEYREKFGEFDEYCAAETFARYLHGVTSDNLLELSYEGRRRVHNLKYYTWVEQQGKTYEELNAQWYDPNYWTDLQSQIPVFNELIKEFNERSGVLKSL